jgi:quinol monooxygenase YgiN
MNVIISFNVKPDAVESFKKILVGVKHDLPCVPGCTGVQVFGHAEDPCAFTLVESWQSVEAHKEHIYRVVSSGEWSSIAAHLDREPTSGYYRPI